MNAAWCIASFVVVAVTNLHGALEFSGYLRVGKEYVFVITDLEASKSSGWIATGGSFQGFKIARFEPGEDVLILSKDGIHLRLPLKPSRVKDAKDNSDKVALRLTATLDGNFSLNGHPV